MSKTNIIRISSQKGGVGKTVVSVNVAVALRLMGYRVLLIDTDLTNPGVGFYLGLDDVNIGSYEVMLGKVGINKAIISHTPSGLEVLPGVVSGKEVSPNSEQLRRLLHAAGGLGYDFVIVDTAPGYFLIDSAKLFTEALIVCTPEMSSCVSSIRLAQMYDRANLKHKLVLNRVRNKKYEMSEDEVEEAYGDGVYAIFPEDEVVPLSIGEHIPAFLLERRSAFSKVTAELAKKYASRFSPQISERYKKPESGGIIGFLRKLFHLN